MWSIVIRELRDRRSTLIAYSAIIIALLLVYIALFPSVKSSLDQFQKIYESYPKSFYQALGIENLSVNTLENYLAIELYSIVWQILALLLASSLAGYAIAGQIEKGTIGFYLSQPVSRAKLFFSKYFGGLTGILVFTIVSVGGSIPLAAMFNNTMSKSGVLKLSIMSLLFAWAVYSIAIFLSTFFSERSKVYMIMGGLLIGMYAINILSSLKSSLAWLDNYSIFHYFNAQAVLTGDGLQITSLLVYGSIIGAFSIFGLVVFKKRDISI